MATKLRLAAGYTYDHLNRLDDGRLAAVAPGQGERSERATSQCGAVVVRM
jgi:hypothetical protein